MKLLDCLLILLCCGAVGCTGQKSANGPVDPATAAQEAIAAYDADGDGQISKSEAKKTALDPENGWDANGDGSIDASEIESRLATYEAMKPGLQMNTLCTIRHKRRPLEGAEVVYEPETFLGDSVPSARGITNGEGVADMVSEGITDPMFQGVYTGLYKVRVSHPDKKIGKAYNEETELFIELSPMDMQTENPTFDVK